MEVFVLIVDHGYDGGTGIRSICESKEMAEFARNQLANTDYVNSHIEPHELIMDPPEVKKKKRQPRKRPRNGMP